VSGRRTRGEPATFDVECALRCGFLEKALLRRARDLLPRLLVALACIFCAPATHAFLGGGALAFDRIALGEPSEGAGDSSAMQEVAVAGLPQEARQTLELIRRGGPYPYRQDGRVFGNREKRLPLKARGYYREYTVPTPGAHDRSARRIVTGRDGEYYYTDDHYGSFRRIRE
jgi:ribonuclease T1